MRRPITLLGLALALAACGDRDDPSTRELPAIQLPGTAVPYQAFPVGSTPSGVEWNSGFEAPVRLVIRDDAAWAEAWATLVKNYGEKLDRPAVDFSKDMLVLVGLGARPNTGYGVTIPSITDQGSGLAVAVLERRPGRDCVVGPAMTFVVVAVRLAQDARPVTFVEYGYDHTCG
jgi:hypothetical protein